MISLRAWRTAVLVLAASVAFPTGQTSSAQEAGTEPLARIEQILVNGRKKDDPSTAEVKVIRGTSVIAATPSLSLLAEDEVITGVNVTMTLLVLDAAAEQDNTVHIGPASQFRLRGRRSIFLILGRLLADVRGLFDVVTSRATLGAKSTEFEVRVTETETQLLVLEGEVAVTEAAAAGGGAQEPSYSAGRGGAPAYSTRMDGGLGLPPPAAQPPAAQHQRWSVEVNASAPVSTKGQLTITNRCGQPHLYDVQGPESLPWFNLFLPERARVEAGGSQVVSVDVRVDPTNIAADTYSADAIIRCVDCFNEPGCTQNRDLVPVQIRVGRSAEMRVRALEEVTIGNVPAPAAPTRASEGRVRAMVEWTNEAIVGAQPTYSARRIIPRYESPEARARAFREARWQAYWEGSPDAFERMGTIYTEWGEGPKAREAFTLGSRLGSDRAGTADYLAKVAEANRLSGELDTAEEQVRRALAADPQNPLALNAAGNLYMDRAEIALDGSSPDAGAALLQRARASYERSSNALASGDRDARAVTMTNIGEVHVQSGNLALASRDLDRARREYEEADQTFRAAHETSPRYAFSRTGWGDAFQGMGLVAAARGDTSTAREAFSRADAQYRTGLKAHPDVPENLVGLGDVLLRQGRTKEAVDSYVRAATVRPDSPTPYHRLGLVFEQENPTLASRYLSTYLELQRPPMRTGRTAVQATQKLEAIRKSPRIIRVPDVVGRSSAEARAALTGSKLTVGTITSRASAAPAGSVIEQEPNAGATAAAGAPVNLVLAAPSRGETAPIRVPEVTGLQLEAATRVIQAAGFQVGKVERKNSTRPPGSVTRQSPGANRTARPGTSIDLEVAQREVRMVRVPDLVGDTRDHAIDDIEDEKLQVGRIIERPGCTPGRVLAQDPAEDVRVPEGTPVTLTIAVPGPDAVQVPRLIGLPQPRAEGLMRERRLRLGRVTRTETDRYDPGVIVAQEPKPDVRLAPGCTIDIEVAAPIPLITVPNFVGMTEAQARRRLPRGVTGIFADLRLGEVVYRDASTDTRRSARTAPQITAPTVIEQRPAAGAQVRKGTEVSLVVLRPGDGFGLRALGFGPEAR